MIKKILIIALLLISSPAQAGILKYGVSFGHSFEKFKNIEYVDTKKDWKTPTLNATYFTNSGLNFSASTNRLINNPTKHKAVVNDVEFDTKSQVFIDSIGVGYKIGAFNPSLVLANVQAKQRIYNNYYDQTIKKSLIVPAINLSYFAASYRGVNLVPSLTFYRAPELDVKGVSANINFMF